MGRYEEAKPVLQQGGGVGDLHQQGAITIGEALEATARTAGNKTVEQSDAAAIQAAEVRATGSNVQIPGGLAAQAQSAATLNASTCEEDKVKLSEILTVSSICFLEFIFENLFVEVGGSLNFIYGSAYLLIM